LAGEKGEPGIVRPYGGPLVETAALPNTHDVTENGMAMEEDKRSKPFRRYICGEDSLRIAADEPYCLHRPMCRGRLNVSTHYSLQQVCDDVYRIWDWILTEKFNLAAKSRRNLSAVIVVPDTLDNRGANPLSKDASLFLLFNHDVSFLLQF
jgi:actin-related protein 8